ncbi:MAG: porin family protein [Rickettsiales bacterium]|jgi:opacity protein-like surface antigen|nr:porin family protein [Rickettsiales bacterium]
MKKYLFFAVLASFIGLESSMAATPGMNVRPVQRQSAVQSNRPMYVGARVVQNFTNTTNTYELNGNSSYDFATDELSFKPMTGGNMFLGGWIDEDWRLEGELGYAGKLTDKDDFAEFSVSATYLQANIIYDLTTGQYDGFYIGAGVGLAQVRTEMDSDYFFSAGKTNDRYSFAGGIMLGYTLPLSELFTLDIGYKFQTFSGGEINRTFSHAVPGMAAVNDKFTSKTGWMFNHGLGLGLRYNF